MPHPIAPWKDFLGHEVREGDTITHPSGHCGRVLFLPEFTDPADQWRVRYDNDDLIARLCLQIGDKGRAVVEPSCPA